jgi:uncharacterized phage protein (TIGR02218 family)
VKPASGPLVALLATNSFVIADLYSFSQVAGGLTLRYAVAEMDVISGGNTFLANGPRIERQGRHAKIKWTTGVQVGSLDFEVFPRPAAEPAGGPDQVGPRAFLDAVRAGAFDNAWVELERAFLPAWPQPPALSAVPTGAVTVFYGRVVEVKATRVSAAFSINNPMELLNIDMPRRLYQAGCVHALYDQGCTVSKAAFTNSRIAAAGSTAGTILATDASPTGWYALGALTFTAGINNGLSRTIKSFTAGAPATFALLSPFPNPPAAGDGFSAFAGCDHTMSTCTSKFSNFPNFGGTPFTPSPETAV